MYQPNYRESCLGLSLRLTLLQPLRKKETQYPARDSGKVLHSDIFASQDLFQIQKLTTDLKTIQKNSLRRIIPSFVDFFAVIGRVTQGVKRVWANDICPRKAAIYAANHGAGHFHPGPIRLPSS